MVLTVTSIQWWIWFSFNNFDSSANFRLFELRSVIRPAQATVVLTEQSCLKFTIFILCSFNCNCLSNCVYYSKTSYMNSEAGHMTFKGLTFFRESIEIKVPFWSSNAIWSYSCGEEIEMSPLVTFIKRDQIGSDFQSRSFHHLETS